MKLQSEKQQTYFDEVIRLYFQVGLGENRIAKRVPVGYATVWMWIQKYKKEHNLLGPKGSTKISDVPEDKILAMYESGYAI